MVKMTVDLNKNYRFESLVSAILRLFRPTNRRTTEIGPRDSCSESSRSSRCQSRSSSDETASPPLCILRMNLAAVLSTRDREERNVVAYNASYPIIRIIIYLCYYLVSCLRNLGLVPVTGKSLDIWWTIWRPSTEMKKQ